MNEIIDQSQKPSSRDAANWAQPISRLKVSDVPIGATNLNIDGRQITSPLQGFGRLWQRTYRVRLSGAQVTPAQVVAVWKENLGKFQMPNNRFYPSVAGVKPGEVVFINSTLPVWPGSQGLIPVAVGVLVLYADDEMFTVMTPEGHPVSGWNTFSAYEEDGATVAQVQGLVRASDPIYEFGYRFMGGETAEDKVWFGALESLAANWSIIGQVQFQKSLIDPRIQWSQWTNIWNNAAIRTTLYIIAAPLRWASKPFSRRKGKV